MIYTHVLNRGGLGYLQPLGLISNSGLALQSRILTTGVMGWTAGKRLMEADPQASARPSEAGARP